ncbi:nuclear transport factor 2-like [Oscarella lobularis]|uniref:nuclear transport factor 2-like n=1 Tax=Oscarella lobularis TaxID=121494 RepID=UPI0033136801
MADAIAQQFVQQYYKTFDENRAGLGSLYTDSSVLTFEGTQHVGPAQIIEKLTNLPFRTVQHAVTTRDCLQLDPQSLLVSVIGQLKTDDDPIHGFTEVFVLKQFGDSLFIVCQIFRLALHNLPT